MHFFRRRSGRCARMMRCSKTGFSTRPRAKSALQCCAACWSWHSTRRRTTRPARRAGRPAMPCRAPNRSGAAARTRAGPRIGADAPSGATATACTHLVSPCIRRACRSGYTPLRTLLVAPDPDPGPSHGSRCRRSRWTASSTAETAARTEAGPRIPRLRGYRIHTSRPCLYPARSRARLLPALCLLSSPRPPSRGPSLTRATAAASGEQAQPLKLPPGPRLGPGSGSGATVGGVCCEVTGPRCVHAVGLRGGRQVRGDG